MDEDGVSPETNAEVITAFLLENKEFAFRMSEIAEATEIKRGSVGPTLNRLEDAGVVEHRGNYWGVSDGYLASEAALVHTSEAAAEYDDGADFDVSAWAAVAEDEDARKYLDTE